MITSIHRNCMGTVSFDGRFQGMRKAQDFIVYPVASAAEFNHRLLVQSDTRIGYIDLHTGVVELAGPYASGAYQPHLAFRKPAGQLNGEQLLMLKAQVASTASEMAGSNGVIYTNNAGAIAALGA